MAFVITEPCVGTCDTACTEVCPMDCIAGPENPEPLNEKQLFINPEECIDCGACAPECPVEAIFYEDDLPHKWQHFLHKNAAFFGQHKHKKAR